MLSLAKYLISSLLLVSFIGCSYLPEIYTAGKVVTPMIVKDEDKLEQLGKVDEIVNEVGGALNAPK